MDFCNIHKLFRNNFNKNSTNTFIVQISHWWVKTLNQHELNRTDLSRFTTLEASGDGGLAPRKIHHSMYHGRMMFIVSHSNGAPVPKNILWFEFRHTLNHWWDYCLHNPITSIVWLSTIQVDDQNYLTQLYTISNWYLMASPQVILNDQINTITNVLFCNLR